MAGSDPPDSRCGSPGGGRRPRRARHGERPRKERVLHTRVSESLADDIRRIAEDLRVPASNLVRNVLEEVFDVVESVSDDVGGLFEEMLDEAESARERIVHSRARRRRRRGREQAAWHAAHDELEKVERVRGAPPPPPIEWHLVEGDRAVGPLSRSEFAAAARSGRLRRDTPVWSAGMADWQPAGDVAALAELFRPPPIPDGA
jgi:hypothetical protein